MGENDNDEHKVLYKCVWNENMHKGFLSAIFDYGLRHIKPKDVLDLWDSAPPSLEPNHVRSHLQKYRRNAKRSRDLFRSQLEKSIQEARIANKRRAITPHLHAYPICGSEKCRLNSIGDASELGIGASKDGAGVVEEQARKKAKIEHESSKESASSPLRNDSNQNKQGDSKQVVYAHEVIGSERVYHHHHRPHPPHKGLCLPNEPCPSEQCVPCPHENTQFPPKTAVGSFQTQTISQNNPLEDGYSLCPFDALLDQNADDWLL